MPYVWKNPKSCIRVGKKLYGVGEVLPKDGIHEDTLKARIANGDIEEVQKAPIPKKDPKKEAK